MALLWVDALTLRWFIAFLVLVALVAGWRYRGKPNIGVSLGAGALAGLGAGAVQIGAAPLLVFWLGGDNKAATVRANMLVYLMLIALTVLLCRSMCWRWRPARGCSAARPTRPIAASLTLSWRSPRWPASRYSTRFCTDESFSPGENAGRRPRVANAHLTR